MTIKQMWELVGNGASPNEIMEMRKLEKELIAESEIEPEEPITEPEQENIEEPAEPITEPIAEPEEPKDVTDYKKLYEESQEALKKAQASNRNQKVGTDDIKSDDDIINDLMRSFM